MKSLTTRRNRLEIDLSTDPRPVVKYSFWISSSALSVKNLNLNHLHTFSRSTMIASTSTWCSQDALPAGVSGLVLFSNKEALSRLSCVDSSYISYFVFHCLVTLLLQTPMCKVCPGTNSLQPGSSSAYLAWSMVHGIIILGHGQPWSMVLSYHGHGIIMDSHGQWYYHPHCNSTRWPFQPLPILPPSPAFPPPHWSSSIRTTHHQGFKSSRRSHNAILRLFHLRNTHLPRLTLDDSRVSRKSLFNDSFFVLSGPWLLYLTLGTNTLQHIPRGSPASLRCNELLGVGFCWLCSCVPPI